MFMFIHLMLFDAYFNAYSFEDIQCLFSCLFIWCYSMHILMPIHLKIFNALFTAYSNVYSFEDIQCLF